MQHVSGRASPLAVPPSLETQLFTRPLEISLFTTLPLEALLFTLPSGTLLRVSVRACMPADPPLHRFRRFTFGRLLCQLGTDWYCRTNQQLFCCICRLVASSFDTSARCCPLVAEVEAALAFDRATLVKQLQHSDKVHIMVRRPALYSSAVILWGFLKDSPAAAAQSAMCTSW